MTIKPFVSIIIVNFCGRNLLEKCLKAVFNTTYKNFEVIIVDNNSSDDSVEFIEKNYPQNHLIKLNKNFGFAIPNNIAAKTAQGKYLVFLNNDTYVTPNWLEELIHPLENDKTIAMAQSLLLRNNGTVDSSGDFIDSLGRAYSSHDIPQKNGYILSPRGACMIARRDTFLDLGGFDESYFVSFEDVEIGWRAWLYGYKIAIIPSSKVYHYGGKTIQHISQLVAFHGVKNNFSLRLTHMEFFDALKSITLIGIIIIFQKLFRICLAKPKTEQRFNIPKFTIVLRGSFWILKNIREIIKKRHEIRTRKVRTNNELKEMGLITKFSW